MIYGWITIFLCAGPPLIGAVFFLVYKKGTFRAFFMGAACFFLTQLILRIPLLNLLSRHNDWFALSPYTAPILYIFLLAFSAGIFEENGRWLFLRYLCRGKDTWICGIAFGLGHGGIEAIWVLTLSVLPSLFNGTLSLAGPDVILVGTERLCAISFHIAMSVLVLIGVRKKQYRFCFLAVLIHGLFDLTTAIPNQGIIWAILVCAALLSLAFALWTKNQIFIEKKKGEII
ncbi:MAG TPA: YhfC family intramembrane metalloprotease [Candidatus Blautia faecavium]|uniref:YhfC family intramembrane metalloprotease n=1 Tax=Candidatus Blautia faecavium TaxID=2838487 RepID=A0A9D2RXU2_9FIRM|nr:YhfC family intramembrane metalloprotease [Candidatus Blautia faecavium]